MTPPSTVTARRPALVALAVASVVVLGMLYVGAMHTRVGQRLDDAALRGRIVDSAVQQAVKRALGTVSVTSLAIATLALVALALIRRRPLLAVGIGVLVLGANVTTQVLKDALTRPDLLASNAVRVTSFPSGHATVAMSLALALVVAMPPRLRLPVGIAGVTYATVVGAATLTGAWHRASDVLGAYLVALTWTAAVSAWLVVPRAAGGRPTRPPPSVVVVDRLVVGIAVLVIAAALVMGIDVVRDAHIGELEVSRAYVVAVVAIAGGAGLTLTGILLALDDAELDQPV